MFKPRLKSVFPPFPVGDRIIRIGGADHGIAAEMVDDERGHLSQLLSLLDGTRTVDELVAAMQADDPFLASADVRAALTSLVNEGYVEDAAVAPPPVFSSEEIDRYRRNFDFFSFFHLPPHTNYDLQARLKEAKVSVLGVGGLGSFVALSLASMGVGELIVVDDDTVEESNLNRQVLYTRRDVGRYKVDAAAERLALVNPHIRVTPLRRRVGSVRDARCCMASQDFFVCAADRPRVRLYEWLNEAAVAEGVPWLRGANSGLTVTLYLHVPGRTACFECEQIEARRRVRLYEQIVRHAMEEVGDRTVNPCTAPVAGLIGNLAALEVVKHLTGIAPSVLENRMMALDLRTLEPVFREGTRQTNCGVCGALQPLDRAFAS